MRYGTIGLINAIPYVFGVVAMILWGRHSDRTGERAGHTAIGYAVDAIGLIACGLMTDPVMTMAMLWLPRWDNPPPDRAFGRCRRQCCPAPPPPEASC
jgi:MFS family permease